MEATSGGYVEVVASSLTMAQMLTHRPSPRLVTLLLLSPLTSVDFVELLLQRGAQADVKNKKGNSPLWLDT